MKKTIIVLLVLIVLLGCALLVFLMPGCGNAATAPAAPAAPATPVPAVQPQAQPEATPASTSQAEPTPSAEDTDAAAQAMMEQAAAMQDIMDAGARALMGSGTGYYDAADPEFFWDVLYMVSVNSGFDSEAVHTDVEGGVRRISKTYMEALASACFQEYSKIPDIPKDMSVVSFDKAAQEYVLEMSDAGEAHSVVTAVAPATSGEEGAFAAQLAMLDGEEELMDLYVFELVPNASAEAAALTGYPLSVRLGYSSPNALAQVTALSGDPATGMSVTLQFVRLDWEQDETEEETYTPVITPLEQEPQTYTLKSTDCMEIDTISKLLDENAPELKDGEAIWKWYGENYQNKVEDAGLVYQLRLYNGVIYGMAPLYSFYFAG